MLLRRWTAAAGWCGPVPSMPGLPAWQQPHGGCRHLCPTGCARLRALHHHVHILHMHAAASARCANPHVLLWAHLRNGGERLQPADLHDHAESDETKLREDRPQRRHLASIPPARHSVSCCGTLDTLRMHSCSLVSVVMVCRWQRSGR